jgi:hypothetical protein
MNELLLGAEQVFDLVQEEIFQSFECHGSASVGRLSRKSFSRGDF